MAAAKCHGSPQVHNGPFIQTPERQASGQHYQPAAMGQAVTPGQIEQTTTDMHTGRGLTDTFTCVTPGRETRGIIVRHPPQFRLYTHNNYQACFICRAKSCLLASNCQRFTVSALSRRLPHGQCGEIEPNSAKMSEIPAQTAAFLKLAFVTG